MDLNKILNRVMISSFIAVIFIALIVGVQFNNKGKAKELDYQFNGIVDSVSYNIKGKASIVVKGAHYYLGAPNWDFDHNKIQKGDLISKKRNSMIIKLIKPDGRIIFQGEEQ
jgi:hypothetical protein